MGLSSCDRLGGNTEQEVGLPVLPVSDSKRTLTFRCEGNCFDFHVKIPVQKEWNHSPHLFLSQAGRFWHRELNRSWKINYRLYTVTGAPGTGVSRKSHLVISSHPVLLCTGQGLSSYLLKEGMHAPTLSSALLNSISNHTLNSKVNTINCQINCFKG